MKVSKSTFSMVIRAAEWWEFKLSPIFATVYATAFLLKVPILQQWKLLLIVLAALVPGAAYVSVINDVTDMREDIASGKSNRLVGRTPVFKALMLTLCILPGIIFSVYWRHDALLLCSYLAAWTAFSFYSIPPVRLKNRGTAGILADASGAHLFPTLVAVILVFRNANQPLNVIWCTAVGLWSFCAGIRGILWHQLSDLKNDRVAHVNTVALVHGEDAIIRAGTSLVFPLEVAAFVSMLIVSPSVFILLFIIYYLTLVFARRHRSDVQLVIVRPAGNFRIFLHEFYEVLYPLGYLLSSAMRFPGDFLMTPIHFIVFPKRSIQMLRDTWSTLRG